MWEYSCGFDININVYGFGIYFGPESGICIHTPKWSFDISKNFRGQLTFKKSWLDDKGVYQHSKLSFNTYEIGGTIALMVFFPELLLATPGLISSMFATNSLIAIIN